MNKTAKDENFPVGNLVSAKLRPLVELYYTAARHADDIADNPELTAAEKLDLLAAEERSFYAANEANAAGRLGKMFATENLDSSLYADLLTAFRRDAKGEEFEIWEQLLDYCRYSAAPVGRFILALYNESPSTYLPAETLCAVLQITNHLQDLKKDMCELRRCYLPQDLLNKYGVVETDLYLTQSTPQLKALIDEICGRLRAMLHDAAVLPCLVRNIRLKAELGIIFSLTNSVLKRIEQKDVIASDVGLRRSDKLRAAIFGVWRGLFARTKSCNKNRK